MAKKKNWFWRNKEGAIVGGILGFLYAFIIQKGYGTILNLPNLIPYEPCVSGMTGCGFSSILYTNIIYAVIIGIIIGASIDSLWRPNK